VLVLICYDEVLQKI